MRSESSGASGFKAMAVRSGLAPAQERREHESAEAQDREHPEHRPVAGRIRGARAFRSLSAPAPRLHTVRPMFCSIVIRP